MTKILVDKAVIEQALEALSNTGTQRGREPQQFHAEGVSIEALRSALEQPPRQPLTDEQIAEVMIDATNGRSTGIGFKTLRALAHAIEHAHGIGESNA